MEQSTKEERIQHMRANIRQHVQSVTGSSELSHGIEVIAVTRTIAHIYDALVSSATDEGELTRARWGVLFRLLGEERRGNIEGMTPTHLSRNINVSKNTVSSLLRGLEDQGLIQRTLDPNDRRLFHIKLTDAGREKVAASAPHRIAYMNGLLADMTQEEQEQLLTLLEKLYRSILAHGDFPDTECDAQEVIE